MKHGPVPPHERSWRHPSELAADEQAILRAEEVPQSTRAFALATGTLGLVAIAVFVLTMTPSRQGTPVAVSASTTAVGVTVVAAEASPTIAAVRRPVADVTVARHALATPIGRGDYAVVVRASVERAVDDIVRVALPSGRVVSGRIIDKTADTALIALSEAEPGHEVSERRPHDREVVTVLATPPITVAFADIDGLTVAEGTAVLDGGGELIGLCSRGTDGTMLLTIDITADAMPDLMPDATDEHDPTDMPTGDSGHEADDVDESDHDRGRRDGRGHVNGYVDDDDTVDNSDGRAG